MHSKENRKLLIISPKKVYVDRFLKSTKLRSTRVGRVSQCPGLSNIMFENRFTIRPINLNSNRPCGAHEEAVVPKIPSQNGH